MTSTLIRETKPSNLFLQEFQNETLLKITTQTKLFKIKHVSFAFCESITVN